MSYNGKYFDILPPEKIRKRERKITEKRLPISQRKRNYFYAFFIALIILGGIIYFSSYYFSKAEITIYPNFRNFEDKINLTLSKEVKEVNFQERIIPLREIEIESSLSQEFKATGKSKIEKKARGTIRVFNEYSTYPLPLRAKTRFMSASGKVFITPKRIVVPGKKLVNGKWTPGFVDIEVEAVDPGEDYNIAPTTFSLPGLSGTSLYTLVYAKSFQKMEGGQEKESPQVTKEDLEDAKLSTFNKLKELQKEKLEEKAKDEGLFIISDSLSQEEIKSFTSVKEGATVSTFTCNVSGKTTVFSFKKDSLRNFVIRYIKERISDNERINERKLNIDWELDEIDKDKEMVFIKVVFSAPIYQDFDFTDLKKYIKGEKVEKAKKMIEEEPYVSGVSVKISPRFVKRLPKKEERIKISLNLD